jgi:hypothetical protein
MNDAGLEEAVKLQACSGAELDVWNETLTLWSIDR